MSMNKLVVLAGVPGSGKSYFSSTIKKIKTSHVYVVSSDQLRKEIGGSQANLNNEDLVWKIFLNLAKTYALDPDGIVILDATHINSELRVKRNLPLKELFDETYLVVWNLDHLVVSNQNLQRDYPIPVEAMNKFFDKFEMPDEVDKEFFDHIIYINNSDIAPAIASLNLDNN